MARLWDEDAIPAVKLRDQMQYLLAWLGSDAVPARKALGSDEIPVGMTGIRCCTCSKGFRIRWNTCWQVSGLPTGKVSGSDDLHAYKASGLHANTAGKVSGCDSVPAGKSSETDAYLLVRIRDLMKYSRLSLSRIPRDSLKYFEISVVRHIRFAELRKK